MDNSNENIYSAKMEQNKALYDPLSLYLSKINKLSDSDKSYTPADIKYSIDELSESEDLYTPAATVRPYDRKLYKLIEGPEGECCTSSDSEEYDPSVRHCGRKLYNLTEEPEDEYCASSDSEDTGTANAPGRENKNLLNIMDNLNEVSYIDKMEPDEKLYDPFSMNIKYDIDELSDSEDFYTPATTVRHHGRKLYKLTEEPEDESCTSSDSEEYDPLSTIVKYNINELSESEDPYTPTATVRSCDRKLYKLIEGPEGECCTSSDSEEYEPYVRHCGRKLYKLTEEPEDEYCTSSDSEDRNTTNAPNRDDCLSPKIGVGNAHVPAKWDELRYTRSTVLSESEDAILHVARSVAHRPEDPDMQDFFRIRDVLMKFGITEKEWKGKDFLQMAKDMRALKKEGTMEMDFCSQLKKLIVKRNGVQELNMEKYHRILNSLNQFSSTKISNEFLKMTMGIKALHETDPLIKNFAWFKKMIEESDNIQIRIDKFKFKGVPDVIEDMQTLLELGLLNDDHLSKFEETAKQCEELAIEREKQIGKIEDTLKGIKRVLPKLNYENMSNTEPTLEVKLKLRVQLPRKHKKKVTPKVYKGVLQSEKAEKKSKSRICRSEHNTPFCSNCGWRYSWLKSFKKRGVYVKNAANFTNENIWQSSIK